MAGVRLSPSCCPVSNHRWCHDSASGSWMPLALMMGIFFFRYAVAVIHAIRSGALDTAGTALLVAGAYGLFSGLFMARAMGVLVVIRQGRWWRGAPDGAGVEST